MNATLFSSGGVNNVHDFKLATNPPVIATMTLEEAAALNASAQPDFRYVFINCAACGRCYQLIDFRCAHHQHVCTSPKLPTVECVS
jgi:hypothetical protein